MAKLHVDEFIQTSHGDDAVGVNEAIKALPPSTGGRGPDGDIIFSHNRRYEIRTPIKPDGRVRLCSDHPVIHANVYAMDDAEGEWMCDGQFAIGKPIANGNFGAGMARMSWWCRNRFQNGVKMGISRQGGGIRGLHVWDAPGKGVELLTASDAVAFDDVLVHYRPMYGDEGARGEVGIFLDNSYCIQGQLEVTGYAVAVDLLRTQVVNIMVNIEACPLPLRAWRCLSTFVHMGVGPAGAGPLAEVILHKHLYEKGLEVSYMTNANSVYPHIKMTRVNQHGEQVGQPVFIPVVISDGKRDGVFRVLDHLQEWE